MVPPVTRTIRLLEELSQISTRNQWSILGTIVVKLTKRLGKQLTTRELANELKAIPKKDLFFKGIWVHSFGSKYAPIICINPAFGRSNRKQGLDRPCSCKLKSSNAIRYFNSHDYNGGRHHCTASPHIATCSMWRPPSTGHLHSWRRGYED
mmetsp:Transcript_3581/g.5268  ORF Transcript_3581/g.5268 Transcript_3581/m.5268 type:complete len:151 (-) Transcript_3581:897-1349(-)